MNSDTSGFNLRIPICVNLALAALRKPASVVFMSDRSLELKDSYLIALEGGGTRSQAALMDFQGRVLHLNESTDVNTNFVAFEEAKKAVLQAVSDGKIAIDEATQLLASIASSMKILEINELEARLEALEAVANQGEQQ